MTYKEILEQLLYELDDLENELWTTSSDRFNVGVAENMVYDKQNEISDIIGNIINKYGAIMEDVE